MISILHVAARVLELRPSCDKMKLYKLCYFSQGWHLAWTGRPLFNEELQAWKYGAVSPTLRQASGLRADDDRLVTQIWSGDSSQLTDYERSVVDTVVSFYGDLESCHLSDLSHGFAWSTVRGNLPPDASCSDVIPHSLIRREFVENAWGEAPTPNAPERLPSMALDALEQSADDVAAENAETLRLLAFI
ncbi:SocA family protein [Corynebacterium diphtheriae bv. mitis]|uniref:Panacea domain-containing protein n=1 Tax=Corynebacterium diphtheriae TaxID=1717 RepID=UPI0013C590F2|nr:Panacea domain-containing protein [Corynebacterium diphtheriae]MBG9313718.1 SocA family protein [Corynebacterium diphtheriae bv. mitis]CAB0722924.1 hypothetical protein FRC0101_00718 [Corynebacterium diphtheriae]CAB0742367.1 hypothetical protein FRC0114_00712 [Corynebacterium diphtheriae]CAB0743365.1 hypothetical protein FRC0150_00759 [Corynebacterium diphtheriae]CAB1033614.1 hypothetical protein FRC0154_00725 [Corynebacterium diphtheriae]